MAVRFDATASLGFGWRFGLDALGPHQVASTAFAFDGYEPHLVGRLKGLLAALRAKLGGTLLRFARSLAFRVS
jgi:hypothetical protein